MEFSIRNGMMRTKGDMGGRKRRQGVLRMYDLTGKPKVKWSMAAVKKF